MPTFPFISRSRSKSKSTPKTWPNPLTEIHTYTLCPHTSPPTNRPLDAQPVHDPTTKKSTISGRCPECDHVFRRDTESAILTAYHSSIRKVERQAGVFDADFLAGQVAELYKARDEEVVNAWKGYGRRWGPGCVGRMEKGRMKLAWERPDLVDKRNKE